jgi:pyruvate formate lyase activating enzyme
VRCEVGGCWSCAVEVNQELKAACFAAGCNFRCPQCQNWETAYLGKGDALTSQEAAAIMTKTRRDLQVNRMAISGGESTLNKKWLIQYVKDR